MILVDPGRLPVRRTVQDHGSTVNEEEEDQRIRGSEDQSAPEGGDRRVADPLQMRQTISHGHRGRPPCNVLHPVEGLPEVQGVHVPLGRRGDPDRLD